MIFIRRVVSFTGYLAFIMVIMSLQVGLLFLLPYPFNKVNVLFAVLSILVLLKDSGRIVWLAFLVHFLIDLYTVTPFGVVLSSGTVAFLMMYWLYRSLFTNRTIGAVLSITAIGLTIYRLLYSLLFALTVQFGASAAISWQPLFIIYVWEMIFTLLITGIFYLGLLWFIPRFNVTLVKR